MRRVVWTGLALSWLVGTLASPYANASGWSDLWRTPEQQGQRLLEAGHPGQAAEVFQDPRRRAYADLRAGRYGDAAALLAPLEDVDSLYNRGNALARSGKLEDALAAYDAALERSPDDEDVRHNRGLVARALQQRKSDDKQGAAKKDGDGQHGAGAQGNAGERGGSKARAGSRGNGRHGDHDGMASEPAAGAKPRSGAAQAHAGAGASGPIGDRAKGTAAVGNDSDAHRERQARSDAGAAAALQREGHARDDKGKESSAAEAAARRSAGGQDAGQKALAGKARASAGNDGTKASKPAPVPETEQGLALDQWLRRIPDDPGGLLRRKFLIEHELKRRGVEL